jgi:uncharacterized protein
MSEAQNHVLIFTKYPHAGYAKTRLIPAVGAQAAAAISRNLTERCLRTVQAYCESSGARCIVHYAARDGNGEDDEARMHDWLLRGGASATVALRRQVDGDLGTRLVAAVRESYAGEGGDRVRRKVAVIGVDIPEITDEILRDAFAALDGSDVVVGPAADGGYYLLGMKERADGVFEGVNWGTETVFKETLRNVLGLGKSLALLRVLRDIDEPSDLPYYEEVCNPPQGRLKATDAEILK